MRSFMVSQTATRLGLSGGVAAQIAAGASIVAMVCLLSLLSLEGLESAITFDEAYNLQVPRNLLGGRGYATAVVDELRPFDVRITTGPTVILPGTLLMGIFGYSAAFARLVIVIYGTILFLVIAVTLQKVAGSVSMILGLAAVLYLSLFETGFRFLGEVPSLAFVSLALLVLAFDAKPSARKGLLVGFLFGLAIATKLLWGLLFVPILVSLVYDRIRGKKAKVWLVTLVSALMPLAVWYAVQIAVAGAGPTWERILELRRFQGVGASLVPSLGVAAHRIGRMPTVELAVYGFGIIGSWLILLKPRYTRYPSWFAFVSAMVTANLIWWACLTDANWRYALAWRPFGLWLAAAVAGVLLATIRTATLGRFAAMANYAAIGILGIWFIQAWTAAQGQYQEAYRKDRQTYQEQSTLADWAKSQASTGVLICGDGWWMPWEIGFLANVDLCDLASGPATTNAYFILPPFLTSSPPRNVIAMLNARRATQVREFDGYVVYSVPAEVSRWVSRSRLGVDLLSLAQGSNFSANRASSIRFPLPVSRQGDSRTALVQIAPSKMVFGNLNLDSSSQWALLFGIASPDAGDGWTVKIFQVTGQSRTQIYSQQLERGNSPSSWIEHTVPLDDNSGSTFDLEFDVTSGPSGDATADWNAWAPLAIVTTSH